MEKQTNGGEKLEKGIRSSKLTLRTRRGKLNKVRELRVLSKERKKQMNRIKL